VSVEYFRAVNVVSPDAGRAAERGEFLFESLEWAVEREESAEEQTQMHYRYSSSWKFRFWSEQVAEIPTLLPDSGQSVLVQTKFEPRRVALQEQMVEVRVATAMVSALELRSSRAPEELGAHIHRKLCHYRQLKPGLMLVNPGCYGRGELTHVEFATQARPEPPDFDRLRGGTPVGTQASIPRLPPGPDPRLPPGPDLLVLEWFMRYRDEDLGTLDNLIAP
jgi:hypothetical protein